MATKLSNWSGLAFRRKQKAKAAAQHTKERIQQLRKGKK